MLYALVDYTLFISLFIPVLPWSCVCFTDPFAASSKKGGESSISMGESSIIMRKPGLRRRTNIGGDEECYSSMLQKSLVELRAAWFSLCLMPLGYVGNFACEVQLHATDTHMSGSMCGPDHAYRFFHVLVGDSMYFAHVISAYHLSFHLVCCYVQLSLVCQWVFRMVWVLSWKLTKGEIVMPIFMPP